MRDEEKIEKRGSEKLHDSGNGLCSLTVEELAKIAGGNYENLIQRPHIRWPGDSFPLGTPNPFIYKDLTLEAMRTNPAALIDKANIPGGKSISNGY